MARFYTERDERILEAKIKRIQDEFENKQDWMKDKIRMRRKNAARVKELITDALEITGTEEVEKINLRGHRGDIYRDISIGSVKAITEHGEELFLTPAEQFMGAVALKANKTYSMPKVFVLDDGQKINATLSAEREIQFFISGERVPHDRLDKALSDWMPEIGGKCRDKIDVYFAENHINPEERAKQMFFERRRLAEEKAKQEAEKAKEKAAGKEPER